MIRLIQTLYLYQNTSKKISEWGGNGAKYKMKAQNLLKTQSLRKSAVLSARQNGYVGGYMTKKLVEMAEQQLSGR